MAKKKTVTKRKTTAKSSGPKKKAAGSKKAKPSAAAKAGKTTKKKVGKKVTKKVTKKVVKAEPVAEKPVPEPSGKPKPKKLTQPATRRGKKKVASASSLKGYDKVGVTEAGSGTEMTESQLRRVKSGLTRRDLNHYRERLLEKRAEILGDVELLEKDAQNGSGGGISYEHMADAGSDNFEQEFTLGLVESERKMLVQINDALLRMKRGIYGVCVERGVPIGKTRLDAKPWAKWCIEVVREKERAGLS